MSKEEEARANREAERVDPLPAYREFENTTTTYPQGYAELDCPPQLMAELDSGPPPVEMDAGPVMVPPGAGPPLAPPQRTPSIPMPTLPTSATFPQRSKEVEKETPLTPPARTARRPTIASPFDFPSEASPPSYPTPSTAFTSNPWVPGGGTPGPRPQRPPPQSQSQPQLSNPSQNQIQQHPHGYEWEQHQQMILKTSSPLIAIPQVDLTPAAPLADGYPPSLLAHGITPESWRAFLSTMSAFLSAKVGDQAVHHAADMGRALAENPKRLGRDTVDHARHIGQQIRTRAEKGDIVGAAMGVVGGAISLPVGTALRTAGAAVSLPFTALKAVTQKPQTPRERATAYAAAANKKWLLRRGLEARLADSRELSAFLSVETRVLYDAGRRSLGESLSSSAPPILAHVEVGVKPEQLVLGEKTLWLVVVQCEPVQSDEEPRSQYEYSSITGCQRPRRMIEYPAHNAASTTTLANTSSHSSLHTAPYSATYPAPPYSSHSHSSETKDDRRREKKMREKEEKEGKEREKAREKEERDRGKAREKEERKAREKEERKRDKERDN